MLEVVTNRRVVIIRRLKSGAGSVGDGVLEVSRQWTFDIRLSAIPPAAAALIQQSR